MQSPASCGKPGPRGPSNAVIERSLTGAPGEAQPSTIVSTEIAFARAAREKGIVSDVAGVADILVVPDLVSGNILAKALEYLAGATAAGLALGLSAPVVLNSRADTQAARLGSLALAAVMAHARPSQHPAPPARDLHRSLRPAPQPEHLCCPLAHGAEAR